MTPGRGAAAGSFFQGERSDGERRDDLRILLLCVFGVGGTLARYGMQSLVQEKSGAGFPFGTLAVNLCGCFFLGLIGEFALNHVSIPPDWRIGITTGFFGAYTTFSSFAWETGHLLQDRDWTKAALYVGISVAAGVALMLAGIRLGDAASQGAAIAWRRVSAALDTF